MGPLSDPGERMTQSLPGPMELFSEYRADDEDDDTPLTALETFNKHMESAALKLPGSEALASIDLGIDVAKDPKEVLSWVSPAEAQKLVPLYGPLLPGQNRPGGLYRKFRNHELGHYREVSKDEAVELATVHTARYLEANLAKAENATENSEGIQQDKIALMSGYTLTKVSRKRLRNDDASSDNFLGPWAPYEGEAERRQQLCAMSKELNDMAAADPERERAIEQIIPPKPVEDLNAPTVTFHSKQLTDYQGRTWIQAPPLGARVVPGEANAQSNYQLPKKVVHTFTGHTKGINRIKWFPEHAHLLLSASMDNTCRIWNLEGHRKCVATYTAHAKAVKDIAFTTDGKNFYSASFDTTIKYWDTEYGKVVSSFGNDKLPFSVSVHPDPALQNVVICASQNKKAVQYDSKTATIVQEYNEHLAAVNTATFCEDGKKIVTTADDKKMFVWEFGIGVVVKHIAEPYMHAMPAVQLDPFGKYLACQSMDNQIVVYEGRGRFRLQSRKKFRGHMCTGYSVLPGFSPDGHFLMSGDSAGRCWFWDWKTSKIYRSLTAHDGVCMSAIWHPHKKSQVATCGWDGLIKLWE